MPKKKKKDANAKPKSEKFNSDKIEQMNNFDLDLEALNLEEDAETEEIKMTNIDLKNLEFSQFMQLPDESEKGNVSLERTALAAPRPIFVGGIPQGVGDEESEEFKYTNTPGQNEPKYSASADSSTERVSRADERRQADFVTTNPEFLLGRFADSRISQPGIESAERVRRFDAERESRMSMFEKEESRYKEYKPKVPE